jgi:Transposase DDE domain
MQKILGEEADGLGRETGFIQRKVKLSGSGFIQALVFGFQSEPELTYGELSQSAAMVGVKMSAQGLEQRFSKKAVQFTQKVLEEMVSAGINGEKSRIPILARFEGVYIRDSSVIELPQELKDIWEGNGGNQGATAALKLQVNLNYSNGSLSGPVLQNGRDNDHTSPFQEIALPVGALELADLGYYSLDRFQEDQARGVYWISWLKTNTVVSWRDGNRIALLAWLREQSANELDIAIDLGASHRIPCRLLIQCVPQEVADQRRRRMREEGRVKGQPVSAEKLALAAWSIIVTNVPLEILSLKEVLILMRIRWQVELLFKLWKSHAKIDEWRSKNPWRILCEIYAKLIGLILNQWIFIASLWQVPERSLFRAAKTIQKFAVALAISLTDQLRLELVLTCLQSCLMARCRQETRKKHPAAFQLLLAAAELA